MPIFRKPLFPTTDHDSNGNWDSSIAGVIVDAGDATDIEEAIPVATDEARRLSTATKARLMLKFGTETGSASLTVASIDESMDAGTTWRTVDYVSLLVTAAGEYLLPFDPNFSPNANRVRVKVSVTQISGSHKFAASYGELIYEA